MGSQTTQTHFWGRVVWWWRSREWKTALLWAPCVVVATGIACLAAVCLSRPVQEVQARYLSEAKSAFQVKNYARAMTCYERIAPTSADRPEILYRLALTAEAANDYGRAATLMRELAPDDAKGFAPAHYWRARQFLGIVPQTPRTLAVAEEHLLRALDGELEDREAVHGLLGNIYVNTGKYDMAEPHLAKAAATKPIFRLPLARVFSARGNTERARQEGEAAVKFFAEKSRLDPANIPLRLAWADAVTFQERFQEAISILEEGLASSNSEIYHMATARVYVAWYDVQKKHNSGVGELIALLDRGLNRDPSNKDLLNRLIAQLHYGGSGAEQGRKVLEALLAKGGPAIGPIHFALAIDARLRNDVAAEKIHLERAYESDSKTGLIANNLAWVLSQPPNPDYTRALTLVTVALEREPSNPSFLDTRGRIYLATERWKEALADLEVVLSKSPNTAGLHAALSKVYEKLGMKSLADEHNALANEPALKK